MAKKKAATKTKSVKKPAPREAGVEFARIGRRTNVFTGDWAKLAELYGGVTSLAKAIGVSYATLHRWAVKGQPVPQTARRVLAQLAADKGLPALPPSGS